MKLSIKITNKTVEQQLVQNFDPPYGIFFVVALKGKILTFIWVAEGWRNFSNIPHSPANCLYFLSISVFFHKHWQFTEYHEKEMDHFFPPFTTSTGLQTFTIACNYQAVTQWDLIAFGNWYLLEYKLQYLFDELITDLIVVICHSQMVNLNLHRFITIILKVNWLSKCANYSEMVKAVNLLVYNIW